MIDLKGKSAVVTGAGQGIGKAIALAFQESGATVYAIDVDNSKMDLLFAENNKIQTLNIDVTNPVDIKSSITKLNKIDILINCVGFVHNGTILECELSDWKKSFIINIDSMYFMTREILKFMIPSSGPSSILNISSVASSIKGVKNRFAYGTTKAAVIGFTKSIAADFVSNNIRCNALCPGTIESPSLHERIKTMSRNKDDIKKVYDSFAARQPIGRIGKSEEVASLALYLSSDSASFITGSTYLIDGGWANIS